MIDFGGKKMVIKHNGMLFPARNDIEYVWDTKYAMGTKNSLATQYVVFYFM